MNRGYLVVAGSGIKSICHLTVEAKAWIRESDIVLYCLADPLTEGWVQQNSREYYNLSTYYSSTRPRASTYDQMTNHIVSSVRKGLHTCVVFYGHPGIYVQPTHKAIRQVRSEGYEACMLPGISAIDCLFADLGVDPSTTGYQSFGATDVLLRSRTLHPDSHVVLWQIGIVGNAGAVMASNNTNMRLLTDYLRNFYSNDSMMTVYEASQYAACSARIEQVPLGMLESVTLRVESTLYIPAQNAPATNPDMLAKLKAPANSGVSAREQSCGQVTAPPVKKISRNGLSTFLTALSESPSLLRAFQTNPGETAAIFADLNENELRALLAKVSSQIHPLLVREQ